MATVRELEIAEYLEGRCVICECILSGEELNNNGGLRNKHMYDKQRKSIKFIKEMREEVEDCQKNFEQLTYKIEKGNIICYYDNEHFLDIGKDGWLYPVNMNGNIDLNNFKNTKESTKMFIVSEMMLIGVGIMKDIEEE